MKAVVHNVEIVEDGLYSFDLGDVLGSKYFFRFAPHVPRKSDDAFVDRTQYRRASESTFVLKNLLDLALDLQVGWGRTLVRLCFDNARQQREGAGNAREVEDAIHKSPVRRAQ